MDRTRTQAGVEEEVRVSAGPATLEGNLAVPPGARGVVLFAHGSGSSRHSPRNRQVASVLQEAGLATLLLDLLSQEEEREDEVHGRFRFDIRLLSRRLVAAKHWALENAGTEATPIGYFGASTGASAALLAAADDPDHVVAIVSRGGRPDLALDRLASVAAPTLLLVGELDPIVIKYNEEAFRELAVEKELRIVKGASHLFEEPGALEEVAAEAREWFLRYMNPVA